MQSILGVRLFITMFERVLLDHIDSFYFMSMNLKLPVHDSRPERVEKSLITIYFVLTVRGPQGSLGMRAGKMEDEIAIMEPVITSPMSTIQCNISMSKCLRWRLDLFISHHSLALSN